MSGQTFVWCPEIISVLEMPLSRHGEIDSLHPGRGIANGSWPPRVSESEVAPGRLVGIKIFFRVEIEIMMGP